MDPLSAIGVAGTVAQLSEITGAFLLKLYKYYVDVRGAPACVAELRAHVGLSLSLLNAIQHVLPTSILTPDECSTFNVSLVAVRQLLKKYDEQLKPENIQGLRVWKWPFRREEIRKLVTALQERNSTFQLALSLLQA